MSTIAVTPNPSGIPRVIRDPYGTGGGASAGIDSLQAGLWVPAGAPFVAQTTINFTANRAYFCRFVCPRAMSVSKIGFVLAAIATANDACDAGIYSADGVTLLSSAGSTLGKLNAAIGIQTLNLQAPVNLSPSTIYYAAFAIGAIGGTSAQPVSTFGSPTQLWQAFGTTFGPIEQTVKDSLFPLTAPAGSPPSGFNNIPIMGLLT